MFQGGCLGLRRGQYNTGTTMEGNMAEQKTIGSVMTPHPYYIESHSSLNSAKLMLDQYGVNHLPVKEGDALIGVIARKDLDRAELTGVDTSIGTEAKVADVCNRAILVIERDDILKDILEEMAKLHLECVLVNSENGLEGIYTVTDACRGYASLLD